MGTSIDQMAAKMNQEHTINMIRERLVQPMEQKTERLKAKVDVLRLSDDISGGKSTAIVRLKYICAQINLLCQSYGEGNMSGNQLKRAIAVLVDPKNKHNIDMCGQTGGHDYRSKFGMQTSATLHLLSTLHKEIKGSKIIKSATSDAESETSLVDQKLQAEYQAIQKAVNDCAYTWFESVVLNDSSIQQKEQALAKLNELNEIFPEQLSKSTDLNALITKLYGVCYEATSTCYPNGSEFHEWYDELVKKLQKLEIYFTDNQILLTLPDFDTDVQYSQVLTASIFKPSSEKAEEAGQAESTTEVVATTPPPLPKRPASMLAMQAELKRKQTSSSDPESTKRTSQLKEAFRQQNQPTVDTPIDEPQRTQPSFEGLPEAVNETFLGHVYGALEFYKELEDDAQQAGRTVAWGALGDAQKAEDILTKQVEKIIANTTGTQAADCQTLNAMIRESVKSHNPMKAIQAVNREMMVQQFVALR
jgi:hypothetical protein